MSDFDSPWKETLERYLPSFLAFFFPASHAAIDWSKGYESLDKELQQIAREGELGKRLADKLFRVWRQDGEETWVLVHIEIQNQIDQDFAERMYVYNYRLYDRFRRPVVSLAVLGDEHPHWRPNHFSYNLWGCKAGLEFPLVKLLDYAADMTGLEAQPNPFGIVVLAHLQTLATRQDLESRKTWKIRVAKKLLEKVHDAESIRQLFRVIDWMMVLPTGLEREFRDEIERYEQEKKMPYITAIERMALEEAEALGLSRGIALALEFKFQEAGQALRPAIEKVREVEKLRAIHDALRGGATLEELQVMLK